MRFIGKILQDIYLITHFISEEYDNMLFRGERISDGRTVRIQIFKHNKISQRPEDLIRFQTEIETLSKLCSPYIIETIGTEQSSPGELDAHSYHYIIAEWLDGKTLQEIVADGKIIAIEDSLKIIRNIAQALHQAHESGVYHREIRPANIFVPFSKNVPDITSTRLSNFGIAHIRDYNLIDAREDITGIFCYMSPEQSGIIKRNVDERSDLYSLGIIFYQLLTGTRPFLGATVATILHQHIAQTPSPPLSLNRKIETILSDIVLRLLEKEAENRYQSAKGLLNDLERYAQGDSDFLLGLDEAGAMLSYRSRHINRDAELSLLNDSIKRLLKGQGGMVCIHGEAGIGKSRLIEKFGTHVLRHDSILVHLNSDKAKNKPPYDAFIKIIDFYLKHFETYPSQRQSDIIAHMQTSIGSLGQIILQLNPRAKRLLGQCPPLVELSPERENDRFLTTVCAFFQHLSHLEGGLIVIIDDLPWCDTGSIELLKEFRPILERTLILFIVTYRESDMSPDHIIFQSIADSQKLDSSTTDIHLKPFTRKQMHRFIGSLLHEKITNILPIADFIFDKSDGNPHFSIELLKQLIDEKAIVYRDYRWNFDPDILEKIDIAKTVLDILLKRITLLNENHYRVLCHAAVIGSRFSLELLFKLNITNKKDVVAAIDHAEDLQLIERDQTNKGIRQFVHNRIKDVFIRSFQDDQRRSVHLKIISALEQLESETSAAVFDLANHAIEARDDKKIMLYAYQAGLAAQKKFSNKDALYYFECIVNQINISKTENDNRFQELWIKCTERISEIHFTIGNNDKAIAVCHHLLPYKKDPMEIARIYQKICHTYYKKGDYGKCEKYAKKGLEMLGEKLPLSKSSINLSLFKEIIIRLLHTILPNLFVRKTPHSDTEKYRLIAQFDIPLLQMYVFTSKTKLVRSAIRELNLNESRLGPSIPLGRILGPYGFLLMTLAWFKIALKYHLKGLQMLYDLKDEWGLANAYQLLGYYFEWIGDYEKSLSHFHTALEKFEKIGDNTQIGLTLTGIATIKHHMGDFDELKTIIERYSRIAQKSGDPWQICTTKIYNSQISWARGNHQQAIRHLENAYNLSRDNNTYYSHCLVNIFLGILYLHTHPKTAITHLEKAIRLHETHNFLPNYVSPAYSWLASAYINDFFEQDHLGEHDSKVYLKKIKAACVRAMRKTKRWINNYGTALLVSGQYHALAGNQRKAEKLFQKSIQLQDQLGRKCDLAISLYEYGLFLSRIGKESAGHKKLHSAYRIGKEIGLHVYLRKIAAKLDISNESTSMDRLMDRQRLSSVIRVSQNISSILNLDDLLDQVMTKAIEVTGAQRGYLFFIDEDCALPQLRTSKSIIPSTAQTYSEKLVSDVFQKGTPVLIADAKADTYYKNYTDVIDSKLKSILCIPIKRHDRTLGVCYLDNPLAANVFSEEDIGLLSVLMTQAAISIENARLFESIAIHEKVLRASEEKHRMILNTMEDGYFESDLNGNLIFFNEAVRRAHGIPADQLKDLNFRQYMSKENAARIYQIFKNVFNTGRSVRNIEFDFNRKDGTKLTVEMSVSVLKNSDGEVIGFRGVSRDISERKEAEQLRIERNVADKANQAKSEFLANMSHEIRTPMNAILGFSELLKDHVHGERGHQFIKAIAASGKTLMTLINDILDLSKIEAGKMEIQCTPIQLKTIFTEIEHIFSQKAAEKDITLITDIAPELPQRIMFDEVRLRQILLNLVGNAVKFIEIGYVKLTLDGKIYKDKLNVHLSVTDTGPGIPSDQLELIFESFQQQKGQIHAQYGGTGLGLAITKKLVTIMGGTITVESIVGKGSTFHVFFNTVEIVNEVPEPETAKGEWEPQFVESIIFSKSTVLIADKTPQNRVLLRSYLDEHPITVIEAVSESDIIDKAHHYKPDLIFMDINPEKDDFKTIRRLKDKDMPKSIPVIAVTASIAEYDEKAIKAAGYEKILRKPISRATVIREAMSYLKHTMVNSEMAGVADASLHKIQLTPEAYKRLSELIHILKTEMTENWETIKEGFAFEEIEMFAERLIRLGNDYHVKPLIMYGEKLLFHTTNFDTTYVPKMMEQFPQIVINCAVP